MDEHADLLARLDAKHIPADHLPLHQRIAELSAQLAAERAKHDATELRLEQTVAQLNHEHKAREEGEEREGLALLQQVDWQTRAEAAERRITRVEALADRFEQYHPAEYEAAQNAVAAQEPLGNPQGKDVALTNGTDKPAEKGVTPASATATDHFADAGKPIKAQ